MKPPASSVVGHLVWSTDGGVWAVWRVQPFPHAHNAASDKLAVHSRLRAMLVALPGESMLLSACERIDPEEMGARMAAGVDLDRDPAWPAVCQIAEEWLGEMAVHRRRYYVAAQLPSLRSDWRDSLHQAVADVTTVFGIPRGAPSADELQTRRQQADELQVRLAQHVSLYPVTAGELCWLYARVLRREADEPTFDARWEPSDNPGSAAGRWRPRSVLAHLTDAVVQEGGDPEDEDRPKHRRYVRVDGPKGTTFQTVLAAADMPHYFHFPGGGGEWLYRIDHVGFPVDWCVRVRSVSNTDAQLKVRRKHRDLVGQVDEYDGEVTGAPPQLAAAIQAIDEERGQLGANPA